MRELDRWLDEHDRMERETAWYEGLTAAINFYLAPPEADAPRNPYTPKDEK